MTTLVEQETPADRGLPGHVWNAKKLCDAIFALLAIKCARSTLCTLLGTLGFSWKKTKVLLGKANPERRREYIAFYKALYDEMRFGERTLIYIDEAHLHQDMDLGYGWARRGERFFRVSQSPGLQAKINWYGAYDFTNGHVLLWAYGTCNGANTADFLDRVAAYAQGLPCPTIIWDGAPVHRARVAKARAKALGLEVIFLPAYSPDLNPIEGLWKWLREEVTYGHCYDSTRALFEACKAFEARVNDDPLGIVQRLWPVFDLDDRVEKQRVSN